MGTVFLKLWKIFFHRKFHGLNFSLEQKTICELKCFTFTINFSFVSLDLIDVAKFPHHEISIHSTPDLVLLLKKNSALKLHKSVVNSNEVEDKERIYHFCKERCTQEFLTTRYDFERLRH